MASLSDRAGFLIAANIVKYAVGFAMPMVLVRMLSQHDYGTLQQLSLIGASVVGIFVLGLPTSIYYFHQAGGSRRNQALVVQTLCLLSLSGSVAWLGLSIAAPQFSDWMNNPDLPQYLPLFAGAVGLGIACEHFTPLMIAQGRYKVAVLFETGETVVRVVVCVAPLLAGFGLWGVMWAILGLTLARFIARGAVMLRDVPWPWIPLRGDMFAREQLGYAIPLGLVGVVGILGEVLDRLISAANLSPVEYAVYTIGALAIPLDTIFQAAVANVMRASLPALVRERNYEGMARLLKEAMRKLSIITLPTFVFLYGHAHEFITLLFTERYADSVAVFRIYLWLVPLHLLVLSPIPQAFGKTQVNLVLVAAVTVVNLCLSFALLSWMGYLGPAVSKVVAWYLMSVLYVIVAVRLLRVPLFRILPFAGMAKVLAAALVAFAVTRLVPIGGQWPLAAFGLAAVLFSVVFVLAAIPLRVFSIHDRQLARRWAARIGLLRPLR